MTGYIPHRPSPRQAEFLALDCLEGGYGGAANGGKSDALLMAALQGVHVPGYAALLLRRTYSDLSLPGALMDRSHSWLSGSGAEWRDKDKTWRFPSGATISFGYLETKRDRYRYQGAELQFIGFDEATQFEERDYLYLFSRLRARSEIRVPLRMRSATNPGGIGHKWYQHRFGIPDAGTIETIRHHGRVFVPSFLTDNPGVRAEDYRNSLAQLDPVTRAQLESGSWVLDVSGLVYGYSEALHSVRDLPPLPHGESWSYSIGVDYGFRDETAWAVLAWSEHEPTAYLIHTEKASGMTPSQTADRTKALCDQYHPEVLVGDAAAAGYLEEARRRYALPIRPAEKTDKRGVISMFRGALSDGTLRVLIPGATAWAEEASALLWKDETQRLEHPAQPNHCCDAALYAWRETRAYLASARPVVQSKPADPYEAAAVIQYAQRQQRRQVLGISRVGRI